MQLCIHPAVSIRYLCMENPVKPTLPSVRTPEVFDPLATEKRVDAYAFYRKY